MQFAYGINATFFTHEPLSVSCIRTVCYLSSWNSLEQHDEFDFGFGFVFRWQRFGRTCTGSVRGILENCIFHFFFDFRHSIYRSICKHPPGCCIRHAKKRQMWPKVIHSAEWSWRILNWYFFCLHHRAHCSQPRWLHSWCSGAQVLHSLSTGSRRNGNASCVSVRYDKTLFYVIRRRWMQMERSIMLSLSIWWRQVYSSHSISWRRRAKPFVSIHVELGNK